MRKRGDPQPASNQGARRQEPSPSRGTEGGEPPSEYLIRAGEAAVDRLLDEDAAQLEALSREIGRQVRIQVEPSYGPGQFDVVLVQPARRPGAVS